MQNRFASGLLPKQLAVSRSELTRWIAVLGSLGSIVGCANAQSSDCPAGTEPNADKTDCVMIVCNGGTIVGNICECPGNMQLFDGICTTPDCVGIVCNDGNDCTTDSCIAGVCSFDSLSDGELCNGDADTCQAAVCVPRTWRAPKLIELGNDGDARNPQITVNANGDAIAVWQQSDGFNDSVWANRYTVAADWSVAELIENNTFGNDRTPQVAIDPTGNAIAVWWQDAFVNETAANRYTTVGGWNPTSANLETTTTIGDMSRAHDIAVDPNGNAIAVWSRGNPDHEDIWAA